ncbi:DegQ family serine endoprotease [Noviherbaspirillum sp. ST9]|uniref:DegQ family serine endoprotease n=1 Tax=Noviherbaspirillum sp. ST9 TaxID=3401606 RepID=UPI003B58B276
MKLKPLALVLIGSGIAVGSANALGWKPADLFDGKAEKSAIGAPAAAPVGGVTTPGNVNFRSIVEQYGPAVVGITTEGSATSAAVDLPDELEAHPFFKHFGGAPGPNGQMPQDRLPAQGKGSGFIVSKDGLILTNAHVVDGADEVTVKLNDLREYKAKVLGTDPATDVAVLKIDALNLPVVNIGDPGKLGVGDAVLAIGSPFGFEQSATAGIVSAKSRSLPGDGSVPFIQTDVAVNPGNSGGPLFDANGAVVGINSQIYSRTGGYQGVSFAIPINLALHVKNQIVETGKVEHARLGVTIQEVNQTLADSFGLAQPGGALVSSVVPGSAAAEAGVRPGDVVLSFNGQRIVRSGDLPALVTLGKPGDKASMEVWRDGKKVDLRTTLGAAKENVAAKDAGTAVPKGKLGLAVRPLTPEEASASRLAAGVLVEQAAGPAARAGIEQGDIILSVNGKEVKTVDQLKSLVDKEHKHVALLVQRGESKIFVPIKIG